MADDFDPATVTWVMTVEELRWLLAAIERAEEVVMDLETTGLVEHAVAGGTTNGGYPARIVLVSFTLPRRGERQPSTWVVPLSHPESPWRSRWRQVMARLATQILRSGKPLTNANVKFDVRWTFAQAGVDLSRSIAWDTQVSSHLLDENASTRLKERAPATFGVRRWDDFDLSKPGAAERVPLIDLGLYAARDTYWTWRLAEAHRDLMFVHETDEEPVSDDDYEHARLGRLAVWCAMPCVATLSAIEQRGLLLDRAWVAEQLAYRTSRAEELSVELAERFADRGGPAIEDRSFAPTSKWFGAWAQAAVDAGELTIAALTPTGKPQWSKAVLVRQARAGSKTAEELLELRHHAKLAEYLTTWAELVTPAGTLHTTYWPGRVVTGRLSSSDPNVQQITAELKPAFIPRPGYVFAEIDYGQIELRVVAYISRCMPMIEALRRGDDLHRILAGRITGKNVVDVTKEERQGGKSANFGLVYGMSPAGFQEYAETVYGVHFTAEESVAVHQVFFQTWDGLAQWHARTINRVNEAGQVASPLGRVRRLPDVWDGSDYRSSAAERAAINSPVQGMASDIMQLAAASIEGNLPGHEAVADVVLVGTVHDSILVELPADRWAAKAAECIERMVSIPAHLARYLDCPFDVPLTAEAKVGSRWGWTDVGVVEG